MCPAPHITIDMSLGCHCSVAFTIDEILDYVIPAVTQHRLLINNVVSEFTDHF